MTSSRFLSIGPIVALCFLAGCAQTIYFRPGASVAAVQRATDACALRADRAAPYLPEREVIPGRIIPERKVCDADGNCTITPAYREPPEIRIIDANLERRRLLTRTCMAEQGFDRISLPYCDAAVRASVPAAVTRTQPPLTEQSCIIPRGQAGYQIVTP